MNGQKHIINREVLELTVSESGHAQSIQNKVSEIVSGKLNPALDKLFSKMSASDEIIRIDKLIIDLGIISEKKLDEEFVERTVNEIRDKITNLIKTGTKSAGLSLDLGNRVYSKPDFIATTKSKDVLAIFVYFLEYGYLPWWSKSSVNYGVSVTNTTTKIIKEVLNVEKGLLLQAIIPLLKKSKVRKRLLFQFNNSHLYELLKKLNEKLFENYSVQFEDLLFCTESSILKKTLIEGFYETVLKYFSTELVLNTVEQKITFIKDILDSGLSKQSDKDHEAFLTEIFHLAQLKQFNSQRKEMLLIKVAVIQLVSELPSMSQIFKEMVHDLSFKNENVINTLIEQLVKKVGKVNTEKAKTQKYKSIKSAEGVSVKKEVLSENNNKEEVNNKIKEKDKIKGNDNKFSFFPPNHEHDTEQITIFNSGLVLIHPFLRYFFEGLNLLDNKLQFKSESEAFKAIHLLQYIATGKESTQEADLPLNKILCGLDVTEPVPLNIPLSDEEKEECLFLIKTVLQRWEALKTTKPEALRDTYLQREGILKQAGQSWNLTIERNTFDVMLEKLPWSVSLIKLPWCEQILYVEW